jgi:hypothetical protein
MAVHQQSARAGGLQRDLSLTAFVFPMKRQIASSVAVNGSEAADDERSPTMVTGLIG